LAELISKPIAPTRSCWYKACIPKGASSARQSTMHCAMSCVRSRTGCKSPSTWGDGKFQRLCCGPASPYLQYNKAMSVPLRRNGQMALVVNRVRLHEGDSDLQYWLSRDPAERIAAVEIIRQRIFGGTDEARQGLQRVCRIICR